MRRANAASSGFLAVSTAAVVVLAATAHGFSVQKLTLNDGTVWVTNNDHGLFGRFNRPIAELDGGVSSGADGAEVVDVRQSGQEVFAWDRGAGKLTQVDVTDSQYVGDPAAVPDGAQLQLGGSTLAVLSGDGKLRAIATTPGAGVGGLDETQKAIASRIPDGAALAVTTDGTIIVASPTSLLTVPATNGVLGKPRKTELGTTLSGPIQVTAVGDVPVVASASSGTLYFPNQHRSVTIPGAAGSDLTLQAPGVATDVVGVSTDDQLITVRLGDGRTNVLSTAGTGPPAVPVRTGPCLQAAWGGSPGSYVRACDGTAATTPQSVTTTNGAAPVFRVNNGEVVLNDAADGRVWLVNSDSLQQVDPNWNQIQQQVQPKPGAKARHQNSLAGRSRPPHAVDDRLGARPGVPVVLHVLDNDSDPNGLPLAITSLGAPSTAGIPLAVSPDAQTIVATLPQGTSSDVNFTYSITDGKSKAVSSARVVVSPRPSNVNREPNLRPRFQAPHLVAASDGSVAYPVLADWRDLDGDPLSLSLPSQPHGGSASVSPQGIVTVNTGDRAGTLNVPFEVSDGVGVPVRHSLQVTVLSRHSHTTVRPRTRADVATGQPHVPITLSPLANDVPGADARNAIAELRLAGPVANVPGVSVSTDTTDGTVTATANRPGTYFLRYVAAFGAAEPVRGLMRLDVTTASRGNRPVAVPDVVVLHGSTPSQVAVLDNDYDPKGNILIVNGALPADTNSGLQVSTDHSEWVDVASSGAPSPPRTVHYELTDGTTSPVTGTVIVVQEPSLRLRSAPATKNDSVVVRSGTAATVDVLANDTDPDGGQLHLAPVRPKLEHAVAGLVVAPTGDQVTVAASAGAHASSGVVDYVAQNAGGNTTVGHLQVRIQPPTGPNRAPSPLGMQLRATAGSPLVIHPQLTGIDPDGDATAISDITQSPSMGRLVTVAPDTITYQPFPTAGGTDTFSYQVVDPHGLTGVATINVGVAPATVPAPPLAIEHDVTASPGRVVHVNVLTGDAIAPGDHVTVLPLATTNPTGTPRGTGLSGAVMSVVVPAQGSPPAVVGYGITDGSGEISVAHVVVTGVRGVLLPPVAVADLYTDQLTPGQRTVQVPVLANDGDPDGSVGELKVTALGAGSRVVGQRLDVTLAAQPQQVPYEITDADGLHSIAAVFVPAFAPAGPYLVPGAQVHLASGGSTTVKLAQVVVDPDHQVVKLAPLDEISVAPTTPAALSTNTRSSRSLTIQSIGHYVGPAAVTFVVYDGRSLEDRNGKTATLTLPVQIGPFVPVLSCPRSPLVITAGNPALSYDIASLCHVWTPDGYAKNVSYSAHASPGINGVDVSATDGSALHVSSKSSSPGGSTSIVITGGGARPGRIPLRVVPLSHIAAAPTKDGKKPDKNKTPPAQPKPVFGSVPTITLKGDGQPVTIDLAPDLQSPLPSPVPTIVSATPPQGTDITARTSGSRLTLSAPTGTPAEQVSIPVVMTDQPGHSDRNVAGSIDVQVIGVPGQPTIVSADSVGDKTIQLAWRTPNANGSKIISYKVRSGTTDYPACPGSPCMITVAENFKTYQFQVAAVNAVGPGPFSDLSDQVEAHPLPGPFSVTSVTPGDHTVSLSWEASDSHGGQVQYTVQGDNGAGSKGPQTALTATFSGLTNGNQYSFTVNACVQDIYCTTADSGSPVTPYGKPPAMPAPSAHGAPTAEPASEQAITVSWAAVTDADDNGSPITSYTVTESSAPSSSGPWTAGPAKDTNGTSQSFNVKNDGTYYRYTVTATNAAGTSPDSPPSSAVEGAAEPNQINAPTAVDHAANGSGFDRAVRITFTDPEPNAKTLASIKYALNGSTTASGSFTPAGVGQSQTEEVSGLTNGQSYTVSVQACNDAGMCGPWSSASNAVSPYTTPSAPNVDGTVNGRNLTFTWSGGGGGGRPIKNYHVCIDGGVGCSDHSAAGSITQTVSEYSKTYTATVTVTDSVDQTSAAGTKSLTTGPAPSLTIYESGRGNSSYCTSTYCHYIHVTLSNYSPSTNYTIWFSTDCNGQGGAHYSQCAGEGGTTNYASYPVTTDSAGNWSGDTRLYGWLGDHVYVTVNGTNSNTVTWS
ncbi:MAG TPA: Ig-like domain-containing protein [Mycobacteriales bacterium]|nr:Ig-like domain-containing protein [Mycobacteriales bacterium]